VAERRELVMREPGVESREVVEEERGGWMRGSGGERWWRRGEVGGCAVVEERGGEGGERSAPESQGLSEETVRSWG
jgi:hypothetical protein